MTSIALVTTGGTIDKDYFDALSEYKVVESLVPDLLDRIASMVTVHSYEICRKDSLEIEESDRKAIKALIESLQETLVLVTHGTDTMVETANYIGSVENKTVVFTGAMRPARFADTDALFNVGVAIGALRTLEPGVYVAMSGQVFRPEDVVKNYSAKRFESKNG